MKRQKRWIAAAIVWMVTIFCFTQLPYFTGANTEKAVNKVVVSEHKSIHTPDEEHVNVGELNLIIRKLTHITVFGILSLLLFKTMEANRSSFLLAWLSTVMYAISDEYHQSFMPGRVPTYKDVLFDGFGALIALVMLYKIRARNSRVKAR